jgi:hypothetical protein
VSGIKLIFRGAVSIAPSAELRAGMQAFIDEEGECELAFWSRDCFGWLTAKSTDHAEAIVYSGSLVEMPANVEAREAKLDSGDDEVRPILLFKSSM